jgi:TRAP-type C4-dicarboxylate transport system substrate-binding protein
MLGTVRKLTGGPLAALVMTGLLGLLVLGSQPTDAAESVTLRFGTYLNETDVRFDSLRHFANLVETGTEGRVKVDLFPSATLHPHAKCIEALKSGISDICMLAASAVLPNLLPCAAITHWIPMGIDWERHLDLDSEYNALLKAEFDKAGLVAVMSQNFSYDQEWFFRKPVKSLAEMKGLNVRTISPMLTHIIKKFGGNPVQVAPGEMFQAAERGIVDAMNAGVATFSSWGMWEAMPNLLVVQVFYGNGMNSMSKEKLESLRPEDRKVILDAGSETAKWLKPRYEDWINAQIGTAVMKTGGSAYAAPQAEREKLIAFMAEGWNEQMDSACGPELAGKLRALFDKYGA